MNKMYTFLRYAGLILVLSLLLGCFAGCKAESGSNEDGEKAEVTTLPESEPEKESKPDSKPQESIGETEPGQETEPVTDPEETLPDTFELAIVKVSASVVRSGPGMDNSAIRKLNEGDVVKVYLQKTVDGVAWGNIGDGWICLDDIVWKEDAEKADAALKNQIVGAWHQLYDDGAEIWTFRQNGTFAYDVYIFDVEGPGSFGESNDQWCGGSYKVENGKLHLTFSNRTEPTGYVVLCGSKYFKDDTAMISATVSDNKLTLQEKQTVILEPGDIDRIMEERNAVSSEDQALIDQLVGSWYMDLGNSESFRTFTFHNDATFRHTIYTFQNYDPEDFTENNDQFCTGSYRVKNGALIMEITGTNSPSMEIPLGGIICKKGDIVSFSMSVSAGSLKLSDYSTTTLLKGGLEEIKALVKENQPEDTPVIDTRILGEWYVITEIDNVNKTLRIGSSLIFSEDGTFTGELSESKRYLYNPETGKMEYDNHQESGFGSFCYGGTYTFDGTTLATTESDTDMGTSSCTVSFSGDTMVQTDEYGTQTTFYAISWDEIGEYFFGSVA